MASIEKIDKKLIALRQKLDSVQEAIKLKKEKEKNLLKEIAEIEAKRNGELFGDMSKAVQQEKIDITPDDMKYLIEALKERKGKLEPTASAQPAPIEVESDSAVEEQNSTNTDSPKPPNESVDEPFPIKDPFSH